MRLSGIKNVLCVRAEQLSTVVYRKTNAACARLSTDAMFWLRRVQGRTIERKPTTTDKRTIRNVYYLLTY